MVVGSLINDSIHGETDWLTVIAWVTTRVISIASGIRTRRIMPITVSADAMCSRPPRRTVNLRWSGASIAVRSPAMNMAIKNWFIIAKKTLEMIKVSVSKVYLFILSMCM